MRKFCSFLLLIVLLSETCLNLMPVFVRAEESEENIISNGTFDESLDGWQCYEMLDGDCSMEWVDGALVMTVDNLGTAGYSNMLYTDGFFIYQNGVYHLEFDVSSSVERYMYYTVQLNEGDYTQYCGNMISIGPDTKTVCIDFTMNEETDYYPRLAFYFGTFDDTVLSQHIVTIDNVKLALTDDSNVVYEDLQQDEQKIAINQVGYDTKADKIAVFRGDNEDAAFQVVDADSNEVVYEGSIYGKKYDAASESYVSYGDFSSLTEEGNYYVKAESFGESYQFQIGADIYENVIRDLVKFYYYQRCGEELTDEYAGTWAHEACHTSMARIYGTNEYIDVSGGWHDAGDYGRYVVGAAKACADLLLAYEEQPEIFGDDFNIPESGNGVPDVLDEVRYSLEWMLKMQAESGGVYHKVSCAVFPGDYVMPQDETDELIVCPVSNTATGDFAAIMAMAYEKYIDYDEDFANRCLNAAKKAWEYLKDKPNSTVTNPQGIVTGEFYDDDDTDERYWAAAQLYKATGESEYNEAFLLLLSENGILDDYGWQTVGNYGNKAYIGADGANENAKENIKNFILDSANDLVSLAKNDGYGISLGTFYCWGSNLFVMNRANLLSDAFDITQAKEYQSYEMEHLNYLFGKNSLAKSYVTGYGENSVKHPHHRVCNATGNIIPGMIVCGPNCFLEDAVTRALCKNAAPSRCYYDAAASYSTNEVCIYWNSALIRLLSNMESN